MPSYLGAYAGAAKDRDNKIVRAIDSVFTQKGCDNLELLVVADGCERTMEIVMESRHVDNERLRGLFIKREGLWAGAPRNAGIKNAKGTWVVYLDIDDFLGETHLKSLVDGMIDNEAMWYYFDDVVWNKDQWKRRRCTIKSVGNSGTSNICHRADTKVRWEASGNYAHDWKFIQSLRKLEGEPVYLGNAGQYHVCHIPHQYDV